MTNSTSNRDVSNLSKKILSEKFDEAQAMIDSGIKMSDQIIRKMIWKDNFEGFKFAYKNNAEISKDNIYNIFIEENNKNTLYFKSFLLAKKFSNPIIANLFNNHFYTDAFFIESRMAFKDVENSIISITKDDSLSYEIFNGLNMSMEQVSEIKKEIVSIEKKLNSFIEFKEFIPKLTIEQELELYEFIERKNKCNEIYNNHLMERLSLIEDIQPLIDKRNLINEEISQKIKDVQLFKIKNIKPK